MRRIALAAFTLTFLAVPTAATAGGGCAADGPSQPEAATEVVIDHACFGPVVSAVPLNGKLTWTNRSGMEHNLTGPAIAFTELPDGATHTVTFDRSGIYVYACTIHPGMSGAVVVGAVDAVAPAAPAAVAPATTPTSTSGPGAAGWAGAAVAILAVGALVLTRFRHAPRVRAAAPVA